MLKKDLVDTISLYELVNWPEASKTRQTKCLGFQQRMKSLSWLQHKPRFSCAVDPDEGFNRKWLKLQRKHQLSLDEIFFWSLASSMLIRFNELCVGHIINKTWNYILYLTDSCRLRAFYNLFIFGALYIYFV